MPQPSCSDAEKTPPPLLFVPETQPFQRWGVCSVGEALCDQLGGGDQRTSPPVMFGAKKTRDYRHFRLALSMISKVTATVLHPANFSESIFFARSPRLTTRDVKYIAQSGRGDQRTSHPVTFGAKKTRDYPHFRLALSLLSKVTATVLDPANFCESIFLPALPV